jgi:hypothetical protein
MRRSLLTFAAIALLPMLTQSCGNDDDSIVAPDDTTAPTVASSIPAHGSTGVALVPSIEINFSETMDATTINDTTITLLSAADDRTTATLLVDYDGTEHKAVCIPDSTLAPETSYTLRCSDAVHDADGIAMESPWVATFETGPFDCVHLADRLEDNDSTAEAVTVEWDIWYRRLTDCDEEGDFFEITLDDTAMVTVHYIVRAIDGPMWRLEFQQQDGDVYFFSSGPAYIGTVRDRSFTFLPGTYYVMLQGDEPTSYALYDVEFATGPPCSDDIYEDNDFPDEAAPITAGTFTGLRGCRYDEDHYALDAAAGQTMTVTVATPGYENRRKVRIRSPLSGTLASYNGFEGPVTVEATLTDTGTHIIEVIMSVDGVAYDMDVGLAD